MENVLPQYRKYKELFNEKLNTGLPQHNKWDHKIKLRNGKTLKFFKIYNLNETELNILRKYFEKNLRKGYIRKFKSLTKYSVIFVLKKNGKLRLYIDYQQLNDIIIKNRTLLPLITEIKNRLY